MDHVVLFLCSPAVLLQTRTKHEETGRRLDEQKHLETWRTDGLHKYDNVLLDGRCCYCPAAPPNSVMSLFIIPVNRLDGVRLQRSSLPYTSIVY